MIAVVAAMGREIECHRKTRLTCGEVAFVEGVGLFRRGETGVLSDSPRLLHIHRRVGSARKRSEARHGVEHRLSRKIGSGENRFHGNLLVSLPVVGRCGSGGHVGIRRGERERIVGELGKIRRDSFHERTPICLRRLAKT